MNLLIIQLFIHADVHRLHAHTRIDLDTHVYTIITVMHTCIRTCIRKDAYKYVLKKSSRVRLRVHTHLYTCIVYIRACMAYIHT